jgi:hypothetical protein
MHHISKSTPWGRTRRLGIPISVFLLVAVSVPALSLATITYGIRCQGTYENDWRPGWGNTFECRNVSDGLNQSGNTARFDYSSGGMVGVHSSFVDPNDGGWGGPDSVDFVMIPVHGYVEGSTFKYPFWNRDTYWMSSEAKLGNNGPRGVRMFASYSCDTMITDTNERMANMFSGGLIVAMGAYGSVWNGCFWGTLFQSLLMGYNVDYAWLYGLYDAYNQNHPVVWATGNSPEECFARMQLTYNGAMSQPHLPNFDYYCYEWL